MDRKKLRTGVNLASLLTAAATIASGVAIALPNDTPEYNEDPGAKVTFANDKAHVLLKSEGTYSRHMSKERQRIDVQDFFARHLTIPFNNGKADPANSCTTLTYYYSSGKDKPKLDLKSIAAAAYIDAVPGSQKASTLEQLRNAMRRMNSGDPEMEGPMNFSTTETCGPETLKAHPEALKKAEDAYKDAHSWVNKLKFW